MAETTITVRPNGPYLVKGSFQILDADGNEFKSEREQVALCRCGDSANKPFCDGSHGRNDFQADTKVTV